MYHYILVKAQTCILYVRNTSLKFKAKWQCIFTESQRNNQSLCPLFPFSFGTVSFAFVSYPKYKSAEFGNQLIRFESQMQGPTSADLVLLSLLGLNCEQCLSRDLKHQKTSPPDPMWPPCMPPNFLKSSPNISKNLFFCSLILTFFFPGFGPCKLLCCPYWCIYDKGTPDQV